MAIKNIDIDGEVYSLAASSGGGGGFLNAELWFESCRGDYVGELMIVCDKDDIADTDTIKLARYINGKCAKESNTDKHKRKRYHGWIQPRNYDCKVYLTKAFTKNERDYWQVNIDDSDDTWCGFDNLIEYTEFAHDNNEENTTGHGVFRTFNVKCGVAIYRDDKQITSYLPFKIVQDIDNNWYYARV